MNSEVTILNRHDFTESLTTEFDNPIANFTLLTPSSGKRIHVKGVYISTESVNDTIKLHFATSIDTVIKIYPLAGITVSGYIPLSLEGQRDEVLSLTATTNPNENYLIIVNYKDET